MIYILLVARDSEVTKGAEKINITRCKHSSVDVRKPANTRKLAR